MAQRKAQATVSEQLQQAIQQSDLSIYALAKLTKISSQQISRFAKGERSLTLDVFCKLATALGLRLAPVAGAAAEQPAIEDAAVLAALKASSKARGPARLADVFKDLQAKRPGLTLGQFHDAIRRLHAAGKVELSPWTGAAYQLKDGSACLIQGTEVMAFVSAC